MGRSAAEFNRGDEKQNKTTNVILRHKKAQREKEKIGMKTRKDR